MSWARLNSFYACNRCVFKYLFLTLCIRLNIWSSDEYLKLMRKKTTGRIKHYHWSPLRIPTKILDSDFINITHSSCSIISNGSMRAYDDHMCVRICCHHRHHMHLQKHGDTELYPRHFLSELILQVPYHLRKIEQISHLWEETTEDFLVNCQHQGNRWNRIKTPENNTRKLFLCLIGGGVSSCYWNTRRKWSQCKP